MPLDAIMQSAVRDVGYQKPIGLTFPNVMMKMLSADRIAQLTRNVAPIMEQLENRPEGNVDVSTPAGDPVQ